MYSTAATVKDYLAALPPERKVALEAVRRVILENLPKGYEEMMQYGMISYVVPLTLYPQGYLDNPAVPLCYAALASQKNHMAVYLTNVYSDKETEQWFRAAYAASGKKIDMGKSCVRFKKLDNLPLDLIGQAIARTPVAEFIETYTQARSTK